MAETDPANPKIEPAAGGSLPADKGGGSKGESGKADAGNAGGGDVGAGKGGGFFQVIGSFGVGAAGLSIAAAIIWGLFQPDSIVRQLGNADVARGAITFVFAVGTIGIALLICLGALIGDHADWQIVRAREVLTVLIGVFGTILGFYFGAADHDSKKVDVAEIKLVDKQLTTHAAGGTSPYRYSITSSENAFKPIKHQISTDGWIIHQLEAAPRFGKITVDVIDSRDLKGSRDLSLSGESPTPSPGPKVTPTPPTSSSPGSAPRQASPTPSPQATPTP